VVRERSAKPLRVGSIPTRASTSSLHLPVSLVVSLKLLNQGDSSFQLAANTDPTTFEVVDLAVKAWLIFLAVTSSWKFGLC
jgi:hypothetical protein